MQDGLMKVGTLARKTGLTVRTLHHYEAVGLLVPAERTEAGHRLYGRTEVVRLQQIVSLRQLGLSLEDIRTVLEQPEASLQHVMKRHLAHLRGLIAAQQRLLRHLEALAAHPEAVSVDTLTQTIKEIIMHEKYYTQEQLDALAARREALGDEAIRKVEQEWATLIAAVRAEMERGTDPAAASVQRLADQWQALIEAFTGGDPGIRQSLDRMYEQEGPEQASRGMVDTEVMAYMQKVLAARKG